MAARANISGGYIWRPGVIGLMMLLFCGWFIYDGFVGYPLQQKIWDDYHQIVQDNPGDPVEHARLWSDHAQANGWDTSTPKKEITDNDIFTQKIIAAITAPVGLYFLWTFLSTRGRWVEADEQAVTTSTGKRAEYGAISSIDKSRWDRKGIAVVHFGQDGSADKIILDDWKYEREPTKRIMAAIEERMPGGGGMGEDDDAVEEGVADEA